MRVVWSSHAEQRQKAWERTLGITRQEVEQLVLAPEQIVAGAAGVSVAQMKRGKGLLRAPFVEAHGDRKIVTVYYTTRVERYWERRS